LSYLVYLTLSPLTMSASVIVHLIKPPLLLIPLTISLADSSVKNI